MSQSASDRFADESLLEQSQRLKQQDRLELAALNPEKAQAEVDAVLVKLGNQGVRPRKLRWHGDLGDTAEDPAWMNRP